MQSLSNLMLSETQRRISSDWVWTEWFPRLRFSVRSSRTFPDPFISACIYRVIGDNKETDECLLCHEMRNVLPLYHMRSFTSPLAPDRTILLFLSRFQRSFALCQGNRHFMSRHWGIKLIRQMHGRLSSIMKTEQEYNEYRYSNHSLRCRN